MGIFSTKKEIFVSSSVYNLAGDIDQRPDYLKTTVIGSVLSQSKGSMGDKLSTSYLHGPGMKLRSFGRWARTEGYNDRLGMVPGNLTLSVPINFPALAALLPHAPGEQIMLQTAEIGSPDYTYWVDRYMVENHPDLLGTAYTSDFNEATRTITLHLVGGATETFVVYDYDPSGYYLYATYNVVSQNTITVLEPGTVYTLAPGDSFPDTAGWTSVHYSSTPGTVILTHTTDVHKTYSHTYPDEDSSSSSTSTASYTDFEDRYEQSEYVGFDTTTGSVNSERQIMTFVRDHSVVSTVTVTTSTEDLGGITRTTTTTNTVQSLVVTEAYQTDLALVEDITWAPLQVLIYQRNTGIPGYDAFFGTTAEAGSYFPFIPVRLDNHFVNDSFMPDLYDWNKKAFKRAVASSYDGLVAKINDNPSIGDIDYAFVTFGMSLNSKENAARRYLYEFFQEAMFGLDLTNTTFENWKIAWAHAQEVSTTWRLWLLAQWEETYPLFGTPEPERPYYPEPPSYQFSVASTNHPELAYNMYVGWSGIEETVGSGLKKPDAKVGDLWFDVFETEVFNQTLYIEGTRMGEPYAAYEMEHLRLNWQVDEDTWRSLDLYGLSHANLVYGGKVIFISGKEALEDPSESGFIVPLHEGIYRRLSLINETQMSTACCYLVFNCYKVVKEKWYQTGWFKVLVIIAIIVIAVVTGYISPELIGLLGTNVAVGTALGLSGTAAAIAGAVANALAAMILTQLITYGSTAIFGEKVGAIVGAVASIIALQVGTTLASGASLASSFDTLLQAENILRLTVAAGKGYAGYIQGETQDVLKETAELSADYTAASKEIESKFNEMFAQGPQILDPMNLTDVTRPMVAESPTSFFSRTLLTGSEVADMTLSVLSDFASISLNTELPT